MTSILGDVVLLFLERTKLLFFITNGANLSKTVQLHSNEKDITLECSLEKWKGPYLHMHKNLSSP